MLKLRRAKSSRLVVCLDSHAGITAFADVDVMDLYF